MKAWQKVIFRNYGMIEDNKIAELIGVDSATLHREIQRLGIASFEYNPDWIKKGFVTVIRNNWDLLTVEQIAYILDKSVEELKTLLVEYDFLDAKVGKQPPLSDIKYAPLTKKEEMQTEEGAKAIQPHIHEERVAPFDFYSNRVKPVPLPEGEFFIKDRFASSYSADYANALTDDELSDYPEEYLVWLKESGANGLWISETLRNLAPFPFDSQYEGDYIRRVNNLKKLTERCQKQGVNVYLYLNEPRSLPEEFFVKYPQLKGQKAAGGYCLCTSQKETQEYLYNAVKSLAENVPLLKGVMTITMSENPTHCYSESSKRYEKSTITNCTYCSERTPQEVAAEVNNIMAKGLKDGNGYTKLIANLWGWSDFMGWTRDMVFDGIDRLDKEVEVLCVSEYGKEFTRGGVQSKIIDYSISVIGPSDISKEMLLYAKEKGHKIWAKVQLNASWECSAMPYIPTFSLMTEHVKRLKDIGVEGLMLGWSLGGYPGGVLPLVSRLCMQGEFDETEWYKETYEENGELVQKAVQIFGEAFEEYPFSIDVLYFGGHSLGCGNLWSLQPDNRPSTMVCFTFDDYENWTKPYGLDIYISQMEKLTSRWEKGLRLLERAGNAAYEELKRYAEGAYIQCKSAENLAKFARFKRDGGDVAPIIQSEMDLTASLLKLISEDAKIGFEMTNHYFYNRNLLLEKECELIKMFSEIKENNL